MISGKDPIDQPRAVLTRPATSRRRSLRDDRGEMTDIVGPEQGSRLDIHLNSIHAGAGPGPYHLHTNAANFYFVLAGRVRLRIDGVDHIVGPGDAITIAQGIPHSVSVDDDGAAKLLEVYAPAGPDFVEVPRESGEVE